MIVWYFLKQAAKLAVLVLATLFVYVIYTFVRACLKQRRLQSQGVYFRGSPLYCFFNDIKLFIKAFDNEGALNSLALFEEIHPGPSKPHFVGLNTINDVYVYALDPYVAQKIYTDVNKHHSKPQLLRNVFSRWAPSTINFQKTDDSDYKIKRKTLSAAFFKSKTPFIIDIIKEVTL